MSLFIRFFFSICAKFNQQPAPTFGQQLQIFRMKAEGLHVFDKPIVESFQSDWLMSHRFHYVIGGAVNIFITKHQQRASGGIRNETDGCFEDHHASAFRSNEGFRNIESVFR